MLVYLGNTIYMRLHRLFTIILQGLFVFLTSVDIPHKLIM